jgi:gliding motility-associatede transport system auxiliary component
MNSGWMQTRQTKYAAYVTVYILVILAVIVVANFLANRYNKSFDATSNKRYSLSDQTKKVVGDLKQDVTIRYFDRSTGMGAAKDLLDRYANLSPKLHIEYVDLLKNPTLARAANVTREGEAVVQVGTRREDAKTFDEEGVTGALIRALKGGERTVCVITGHGEHRLDDSSQGEGFSGFKTVIEKNNYRLQPINLLQKAEVPSDCTVLVVAGPTGDYIQPEVDALKKYVENGGRAFFMLDPPLKLGQRQVGDNQALSNLLEGWGVTLDKNLLLDESAASQLLGGGPEAPVIMQYDSHPIVNDLTNISTAFPLSRSLETKNTDKTTISKLFSTSADSFATDKLASAEIRIDPNKDKHGPFTLAVAGTYSTGKPNNEGRFVVVGNSGWASNQALGFSGNRNLLLNAVNWLSSDEDLISIRPVAPEDRRITLTRAQFRMVQSFSQFFLPLIVIFGGVMVWLKRR